MRPVFAFVIALFVSTSFLAQENSPAYQPLDLAIFDSLKGSLEEGEWEETGVGIIAAGKAMLGTPYVAQTLEVGDREPLVVNFRGMDCTTFVENALVLGHLSKEKSLNWKRYLRTLEEVRYREGKREGYASRLHYFTEWIRDNSAKGYVKDITEELSGVTLYKEINFMGTHRKSYPFLADEAHFDAIVKIEKQISKAPLCILPRDDVASQEAKMRDGDIIALATDIDGLDVTHTGLAIRMDTGRIHLLHASTSGQVMITSEPLADYLKGVRRNVGIVVARPQ
ncbi:Protein of unknown function [Robiginitalea myxolifaciens]|uniref:DUF1460 domain-containing protein n=1 Tax=Robiginitalea myxolifaciens TaxID=400055 RepID=A0A1I6G0U3_9FLAO|nr:N-acetylmuramoyl-L-alanine amidase-like domain-containing protein [Robiginitalea myxolifaciens]SFR35677.1 Protein of unknown function [Robiginitalea myxolifaciens]